MNVRRPLHRQLALLAPLALSAVLLVGCGDDDADPQEGASDSTSETGTPSADPSASVSDPAETDGPVDTEIPETDSEELPDGDDGEGGEGRTDVPADAAELCRSFEESYQAISAMAMQSQDGSIPPGISDVYHAWADELADVELPASFTDDQRDGVQVMSRLLASIPDDAQPEDFDDLEDSLSPADEAKVESVTEYVSQNCGIEGM